MKEYYTTADIIKEIGYRDTTGYHNTHFYEVLNFMGYSKDGRGKVKVFTQKEFHNIVSHLLAIKDCKSKLPLAKDN